MEDVRHVIGGARSVANRPEDRRGALPQRERGRWREEQQRRRRQQALVAGWLRTLSVR